MIAQSEVSKQRKIHQAQGLLLAPTADGLRRLPEALRVEGGARALQLRIAEDYRSKFGELVKAGNPFVVPANRSHLPSMNALATEALRRDAPPPTAASPAAAGGSG